jgi:plasmid stabilization system protein ParE
VAVIVYGDGAFDDLRGISEFLAATDLQLANATFAFIRSGIEILADHPFVGRLVELDLRELVLSRGRTGYVVLYDYDEKDDSIVVCAIRHQRESGYRVDESAT